MVFVVDDLVAWLVGRLADSGYKKLSTRLRGSEQERALRQVATAAVQATASELCPSGQEQAEQFAVAISGVFNKPNPPGLQAGQGTLLEALQAGIAGQIAVLDDAGRTSGEQWAVSVRGLPGRVVAGKLTDHLVREIMVRGSHGGPLTPLAVLLNFDLDSLKVGQVKGMLAELSGEVRAALAQLAGVPTPVAVGRPLKEVRDPFALEVHRPVQADGRDALPPLTVYVSRDHDAELDQRVVAAAAGSSQIAVLVGGSSTGKTRACWEALQPLREQDPVWRLWHPIDPSRPEAAMRDLPGIGPRTVVWLNEAQFYLDTGDRTGERVAAGLRELLRDPARAPVLVLATLWPQFWDVLTARPVGDADPHAQARELLAGHDISVPPAFTQAQLHKVRESGDARLTQAAKEAQGGGVVQYLAGAPELLARYRNAPPAAKALIDAAMDARRLGMRPALPLAFLAAAAPGYLTDTDWDQLADDWLERALAYTATPCKGVRGPVARIRDRSAHALRSPARRNSERTYQLADYLDQHGRRVRCDQMPPSAFWEAVIGHAHPADLWAIAYAAHGRGLYRTAARLYKRASVHGDAQAAASLVDELHRLHPADHRPAAWAATHAPLDNLAAVGQLLDALRRAGATDQVTTLAIRATAHPRLDDPGAVCQLLDALRRGGATDQVTALLDRDPGAHVPFDDPDAVGWLLDALQQAGATDQITALLDRDPAAQVPLDDLYAVSWLLDMLQRVGATGQVTSLATRAAQVPLDDPGPVSWLLDALQRAGATDQITALLDRDPAANATLDDPGYVGMLLGALQRAGASDQITALLDRDPASHAILDNLDAVDALLQALQEVGDQVQAAILIERLPDVGMFEYFCLVTGGEERFRFGREADGHPAASWSWEDLS